MSGEPFQCGYGAIVREDVEVLEASLWSVIDRWSSLAKARFPGDMPTVNVLEIGMHDGGTAKGLEHYLRGHGCGLNYIGIDPDDGTTRPRYVPEGGKVIVGDSAEVFGQVPDGLDLVWVDGCHCINHVILDTLHYSRKVRPGGFMLFHDINPAGQGVADRQPHGPDASEFRLAIDAAHKEIGFPYEEMWYGWDIFMEKWPTDRANCGTRAYRRTA